MGHVYDQCGERRWRLRSRHAFLSRFERAYYGEVSGSRALVKEACLLQGLVSPLVPGDEPANEGALKDHVAYLDGDGADLGAGPR